MEFNVTMNRKTYEPAKYSINVNRKQPTACILVSSLCSGFDVHDIVFQQ